jgi:hypothetical protein
MIWTLAVSQGNNGQGSNDASWKRIQWLGNGAGLSAAFAVALHVARDDSRITCIKCQ